MSAAHPAPPHEDDIVGRVYDARLVGRLKEYVLPETPLLLASTALMFVVMGAQLMQPWIMKLLIDEHLLKSDAAGVARLALLYFLTFGVELVARFGQLYTMERTGQNVIRDLRCRVFAHLQSLDSSFFDANPVGRLMTRVTTDVESLADLFASGAVSLLGDVVKLCAIVALLWWLDWRLALVTFTAMPVLFVLSVMFRGRIRQSYRDVRRRIARINAFLQEAIGGMLLVQLYRREPEDRRDFEAINRDHRDAEVRSVVYESTFSAVVELVGILATAAIIWYGGGRIALGVLTFGTLVAFLEYTARFFGPIRDLSGFYAVLQAAMASLERLFDLLDTEPTIVARAPHAALAPGAAPDAGATPGAGPDAGDAAGRIVFDRVSFAYVPGEEILHDVSFAVEPGMTMALVGATGAGKTTVIKLLLRLYDPTAGRILLDGRDLKEMPPETVRRRIGVVMQDHFLISGTVAENIAFGDPLLSRERIVAAARQVHADPFVRAFPRGYDEAVRERGGNLSVGQKQLLSLARAVASDPSILILDEATSSVDTETELLIQDALRVVLRGRTSIIIAHRLSTILAADRILVFHHGRLAEAGPHAALLARGGLYARLCELQFGTRDAGPLRAAADRPLPAAEAPA
ncbi:MAG TPA: ABC transporter ATP-binding protein [Patescibacteria group bacterium]|nr:ABC transporter ATP-binding protein [Patescibacteria group bacterium]